MSAAGRQVGAAGGSPAGLPTHLSPAQPQVLHCRELGVNAMVVMEQFSELEMLLCASKRLGVRPAVGIRAKLATRHSGHWGSTSGERAGWRG